MKRGNGQGSVYKRGKTWTAQVTDYIYETVDGDVKVKRQKYKRKGGFRTKKEAVAYIEQLRSEETRKAPTLLQLYTAWYNTEYDKLSKDKKSAYNKARERLESIIGRRVDTLTTADLQAVVSSQTNTYYTARDMKTLLSHLYKRAMADQFVPANLSQFITLPKLEEKEPEPFSPSEVQTMWKSFEKGDTFIGYLLLMIYSGMMPGELLACEKSMIDFDRCEIYGCGKKTKTRKNNAIVFAELVKPVLQILCTINNEERLYPSSVNDFYDDYHAATKRIGIRDLPPYSCRHTTGTEAAKRGVNAPAIQRLMRHANISTSQRYIHLGVDEVHKTVNKL